MSKKTDLWDKLVENGNIKDEITSGCSEIKDGLNYKAVTIKMLETEIASWPVEEEPVEESKTPEPEPIAGNGKKFCEPPIDAETSPATTYIPYVPPPVSRKQPTREPEPDVVVENIKGEHLGRVEMYAVRGLNNIDVRELQLVEGDLYVGNNKVVEQFVTASGKIGYLTADGFQWRQVKE